MNKITKIKPNHFTDEFVEANDDFHFLERYVKDDVIQSFFLKDVCLYNFDINNEIVEYCEGDLEVYIAHPYNDSLNVRHSDVVDYPFLFKMAFYMTDADVYVNGQLMDYKDYIIEIQIPDYIRTMVTAGIGYTHFCNSLSKDGGIIIQTGMAECNNLARWKYFVLRSSKSSKRERYSEIHQRLIEEAKGENYFAEENEQNDFEPISNKNSTVEKITNSSMESPEEELNQLVGLASIKTDVINLTNFVKMQKTRERSGLASVPISLHLVFTGNPGTGKTTVARILAQIYKEIGILSKGQLIEVDRAGLVAGYVGQTAIKTQEKIEEAKGGILFIDEAYTLAKGGNDFGQEAIDTILKAMEDNRNDFIVVVAGYPEQMKEFINSNPGLKSRFNKYFHFDDYNERELMEIFESMCQKYDYKITNDAKKIVGKYMYELTRNKDLNFANARDVRNYFETVISNQASRVMIQSNCSSDELVMITENDVYI